MSQCWVDTPAFVEKASWAEMCALIPDSTTREEFEHALRMAFADDAKMAPATKAKLVRAFAGMAVLRETVPRIAPRVFEGFQSEVDALLAADGKTRKKPEFLRGVTVGGARPPAVALGLLCWMRIAALMDEEQLQTRAAKQSALAKGLRSEQEEDEAGEEEELLLSVLDGGNGSGGGAALRLQLTPQQRRLRQLLPPAAPRTVALARLLLSRVVPLTFVPPFLFASSANTIAGLLSAVTAVAADAAAGVLACDPMSRCALVCVAAPPDMVEAALVTELLTADVAGEKGFFRTPVACPPASEQPCANPNEIFTIAHWFSTSDAAAPFTPPQIHHAYLVYALRRAVCRSGTCPVATRAAATSLFSAASFAPGTTAGGGSGPCARGRDGGGGGDLLLYTKMIHAAFPPLGDAAAQRWRTYCDALLRGVQAFATGVLGGRGAAAAQHSAPWISSSGRGAGLRMWDALLREAVLLCEAACSAPPTRESEQLSAALWMLLGHIQQGLRAALVLREYEPMLDIRSDAEGAAANSIVLASGGGGGALRPFLCHPEQLFAVCRAALRCDVVVVPTSPAPSGLAAAAAARGKPPAAPKIVVASSRGERTQRAGNFLRETLTEEMLVSLALDPAAVPSTIAAAVRFAAEFGVAPLTDRVPHALHALFSFAALSPLVGGHVLADHMRSLYALLSPAGRVELLLRILFLPLTCAALELQVALSEAPDEEDVTKDAGFCLFALWRAVAPINAVSREQAAALPLTRIFSAAFAMAFDGDSEFRLMWECCMLDDLQMMGERERVAAVCVKDSLIDAFFDCVAEDACPPAEGILHAATFMFRFGVFPRMHCAAVLKRLVLHVRVLLGGFSSNDPAGAAAVSPTSAAPAAGSSSSASASGASPAAAAPGPAASLALTRGDAMATTLLQFLCGFGAGKVGVLHDDFDRYSDAFFDAVANVLVIVGKFASSSGEASATRVFQSLHDLAWDCLAAFTNTVASAGVPAAAAAAAAAASSLQEMGAPNHSSILSSGHSERSGSSARETIATSTSGGKKGTPKGRDDGRGAGQQHHHQLHVSAASLEGSCTSGAAQLSEQPTVGYVGLRVVGLRSLPSTLERMLRRLEAIALSISTVSVRHPSLRERAVYWLRNCWKTVEKQSNSGALGGDPSLREKCEQLCITCSSLCNLLLNHTDVLM